jgi:hypothetical protein
MTNLELVKNNNSSLFYNVGNYFFKEEKEKWISQKNFSQKTSIFFTTSQKNPLEKKRTKFIVYFSDYFPTFSLKKKKKSDKRSLLLSN